MTLDLTVLGIKNWLPLFINNPPCGAVCLNADE